MRRKVSEALKKQVAFSQDYICSGCNKMLPPTYQIDHILPFSISHNDDLSNLTALCPNCHARKTQKECKRIIYYKKLIASCNNCQICYFCLEEYGIDSEHICDKICKPIKPITPKPTSVNDLYKFALLPKNEEDSICKRIEDLKISSNERVTLYIKLTRPYLIINHHLIPLKDESLTPHDVGQAVKSLTDNVKEEQGKYTHVEFDIYIENTGGDGGDACIEYLSSLLPQEMPQGIFKPGVDVSYTYFSEDT